MTIDRQLSRHFTLHEAIFSQVATRRLIAEWPDSPGGGWLHISFDERRRGQCLSFDGLRYRSAA